MSLKLFMIRKTKGLFLKLNLHQLFSPLNGIMLNLVYLNRFSKWRKNLKKLEFDDFYDVNFGESKRYDMYKFVQSSANLTNDIDYLEFGVAYGLSFKWWVENNTNPESRFWGFDTFEGLPENFNFMKKSEMSTGGQIPQIDDTRHTFLKGLFQDTLPGFLKSYNSVKRKVINLDADLYSSTLYVLASLAPYLNKGDIIFFDEFGVPLHEFRAVEDFFNSFYIKYEVLAACNNYFQIAVKIV